MADPELDLDALGTLVASATGAGRYRFVLADADAGVTADALEKGGAAGAGILLDAEAPDQGGKAELALGPKRADLEKKIDALASGSPRVATFVVATPAGAGGAAKASAGPVLSVKAPVEVIVTLDIDPADPRAADDRFILAADDGSAEVVKTVKDDAVPGDKKTTLVFTLPDPRKTYSIRIDPGAEGAPYWHARGITAAQAK